MNDNDPRNRSARLERTLTQARQRRQRRTTSRLLLVISALASALVVFVLQRYDVL